jgi:hypothetical protein
MKHNTQNYHNTKQHTWGGGGDELLIRTPVEAYAILETACFNEAKPRTDVLEWFESFRAGQESLEDGPSSGQLSTDRKPTIVSKLHELVDTGRQITLKLGGGEGALTAH